MKWIASVLREVWGLFVDDGSFALAIVLWLFLWLAIGQWILPRLLWLHPWAGPALFAGLALILVESAARFARKRESTAK